MAALAVLLAGCGGASTASVLTAAGDRLSVHSDSHADSRLGRRCQQVAGAAHWAGVMPAGSSTTTLDEYDDYFVPTCLVVPRNKPVMLVVTNHGHMPHTVTVRGTPVDTDVDSGQTAFVKVPPTKRPLRIVCTFHIDERMFAGLIPAEGPQ